MNIKGIGTDIIQKDRIDINNEEFINRYLNEDELLELNKYNSEEEKLNFLTGRWASKESIVKASNKEIVFSSISVLKSTTGKPVVKIEGVEREDIHISISHEKSYTIAFCIIEKV